MEQARQSYLTAQVNTVNQGDVVVLLFEKALLCLTQAKEKIAEKDFAAKGLLISRAMDIINLLDTSLNLEQGGELAENLHNLYFYCNTQLLQANLKLDCEKIDAVMHTLSELNDAFSVVVQDPEAKAVAEEIGKKFETGGREQRATTTAPSAGAGSGFAKNAYAQVARNAGLEVANNKEEVQKVKKEEKPVGQTLSTLAMATALMGNGLASANHTSESSVKNTQRANPLLQKPASQNPQTAQTTNSLPLNKPLLNNNVYASNMLQTEIKSAENEEKTLQNSPNKLVNPLAKNYMKANSAV